MIIVSHDARLVTSVDSQIWVCDKGIVLNLKNDFEACGLQGRTKSELSDAATKGLLGRSYSILVLLKWYVVCVRML